MFSSYSDRPLKNRQFANMLKNTKANRRNMADRKMEKWFKKFFIQLNQDKSMVVNYITFRPTNWIYSEIVSLKPFLYPKLQKILIIFKGKKSLKVEFVAKTIVIFGNSIKMQSSGIFTLFVSQLHGVLYLSFPFMNKLIFNKAQHAQPLYFLLDCTHQLLLIQVFYLYKLHYSTSTQIIA